MIELSVVKSFILQCKVPSKVHLYGSFSLNIAGFIVEYAYKVKGSTNFIKI